jgi:non-specific serine/threonine protein kinase
MAKSKKIDVFLELKELGLNDRQISVFCKNISEKYWEDSIRVYKKLHITRKSLDEKDKIYVLIRDGNKSYDVNIEIVNSELVCFCNCSNRDDFGGCAHFGAVLLYKMLLEKKNDFNLKLSTSKKIEEKKSDLIYFKNLFPENLLDVKKYMIYFNFENFEKSRQILNVERGIIKNDGGAGAPIKFNCKNFHSDRWEISKKTKKVLTFMNGGDNYGMKYSSSGLSKSVFYDINSDLMMPYLRDIYFEEPEIILGATFSKEKFNVAFEVKKASDDKYVLEPFLILGKKKKSLLKMNLVEFGSTSLWIFDCDTRCFSGFKNDDDVEAIRSVIRFPKKLVLDKSELLDFFKKYYQKILNNFEFNLSSDLIKESKCVIPKPKLYLEKSGIGIKFSLKFLYATNEVDYFSSNKEIMSLEQNTIYEISRDLEVEDSIVDILNENQVVLHETLDEFVLEGDLIDFVTENLPKIIEKGIEVLGEENLFNFKLIKNKPQIAMNVSSKTDWFNINGNVSFGKHQVDIKQLIEAIFQNKRFVSLSEKEKAVIPKEWISNLKSYSGFFDLSRDEMKLSKYHASILENFSEITSSIKMDTGVKEVISRFKQLNKIVPVKLSSNVHAKLRDYQKAGYDWLYFLRESGFNGILADDMGLGKTLQTLSLLQKIKDEKKSKTFLIVVPTSLVFNWKDEIEKFTPEMNYYLHHGPNRLAGKTKSSLEKFNKILEEKDIIITTYGTLRNDLEIFKNFEFEYIVLDEAHIIKNPLSISAKTVYDLKGKNKLILSGTPIQNNLTEIWSLFNFLNPGYLGNYDFFRENFVLPIERNQDEKANQSLRRLISPFLLRRSKEVISKELPDKTEIVLHSSLSSNEKEIYDTWKEYYKNEIKVAIKEKGVAKSKMKILEGLTKLRQICLHPKMIDSKYEGSSAKFNLLMMELENVMAEGHKVLVFSSFVKMLTIIKEEFESKGLKYSYLDGKTTNREKVVSSFQESKIPQSFLISIKAGGLGLNLTGADYVFIVDPWWNPAVEMQAMDRAHRLGQKEKVFVYKMIAKDTIEEKILDLQKSKMKLVKDLIVEDKSLLKNIDIKELEKIFE